MADRKPLEYNQITLQAFAMDESIVQKIGRNETGPYYGDGDCRMQLTWDQQIALNYASAYGQAIADAFVNFCSMTFDSRSIPSCFRQDLTEEEIAEIRKNMPLFQKNFAEAIFRAALVFDF